MQYSGQNAAFMARLSDSFYRHRWLFCLAITIVIGVTAVAVKLRKPAYRAAAQTQVVSDNRELASVLGKQDDRNVWTSPAQQNVTQLTDLLGDDRPGGFIDTALKAAQLSPPINVDPRANDPRYALLRKRLVLAPDSDTLFSVALTWENPYECSQIVAAIQAQYIEEVSRTSTSASVETMKFLEKEMGINLAEMQKAEKTLIDYKTSHSGELPDAQSADIAQYAALKNQRDALLIAQQDSALRQAALEKRIKEVPPQSLLSQTSADGPILLGIREARTRRASLIAEGEDENSDRLQKIDHSISVLTAQAAAEAKSERQAGAKGTVVQQTIKQDNPEYQDLQQQLTAAKIAGETQASQIQQLTQQITDYEARIAAMPEAERALNDKTRSYAIVKARYEKLVEEHEDAKMKARLQRITAQSTLIPVGTIYPQSMTSKSKTMLMLVGGVAVGLVIGVALVIFSEWTDPTLRYGSDVERILDVPLLCEMPEMPTLDHPNAGGPPRGSR